MRGRPSGRPDTHSDRRGDHRDYHWDDHRDDRRGTDAVPRPCRTGRDDTTRYLCAAAHTDPAFADRAIREFLVEHTRPVPASPGVDTAAVLAEAVAARTRRELRDLAVVLLSAGLVFLVAAEVLLVWAVVAVAAGLPAAVRKHAPAAVTAHLVAAAVLMAALVHLRPHWPSRLGSDTADTAAVLVGAALFAVLAADRFVVWWHLATRFWPNRLTPVRPWPRDRRVFRVSLRRRLAGLRRVAEPHPTMAGPADGGRPVPLVVYRGADPFVGAGHPEHPWSTTVPLARLPGTGPAGALTTAALYAGIDEEIAALRGAHTLSPGRRLGTLGIGEVVFVSAAELIDHLAEPPAADFLTEPGVAPFTVLRRERADALRDEPGEWARYHRSYHVAAWDRDLVVTVFVHVAVGGDALHVECTPCVLRPVREDYRRIDGMARSPLRPAARAVLDLLALPASLPGRLTHLLTFPRPLPGDGGVVNPDAYGAAASLRELAEDREVHDHFQRADADRYARLLEDALVRAVSRVVRAAGYSPAPFDARAAAALGERTGTSRR